MKTREAGETSSALLLNTGRIMCNGNVEWVAIVQVVVVVMGLAWGSQAFDYRDALEQALVFYEGQRSGMLPPDQRLLWRGNSALSDGNASYVDLTGGYYDAGDNVKYQFPMAFTVTLLAWSVIEYSAELQSADQLPYALRNIVWGTDYFLKALAGPTLLYVQVGDPNSDHVCWERPEDMDTPRGTLQINATSPGTEVAAETAAALAAASLALRDSDPHAAYAQSLLDAAFTAFDFADRFRGTFTGACPFYCSASGYNDELLWAAAWLYKASNDSTYLHYLVDNAASSAEINEFSWDNKHAGVQVFLSKLYMDGEASLRGYASLASAFACHVLPRNPLTSVSFTPGGLLFVREGANMQYVTGAAFLISMFADYLANANQTLTCGDTVFSPHDLLNFTQSQADYILGANPGGMSYMAGFGASYPMQVHHRGASIVSVHENAAHIGCGEGFYRFFDTDEPNPNLLTGAVVGGPDSRDAFRDIRRESSFTEPTTYINAAFVGVLARLLRS